MDARYVGGARLAVLSKGIVALVLIAGTMLATIWVTRECDRCVAGICA